MPFNQKSCNDTSPILIDRYENGKFLENSKTFFPEKVKNLHKCQVRVSVANNLQPFGYEKMTSSGELEVTGKEIFILRAIAENLNFTINFTYIGHFGYFYESGTFLGPLKTVLDNGADLTCSKWWLKNNRLKFFVATISYSSDGGF